MCFVYLLQSRQDKTLYIGFTSDLKKRLSSHNKGEVNSTRDHMPFEIVYYEAYKSAKDARRREWQLKNRGSQREALKRRLENSLR